MCVVSVLETQHCLDSTENSDSILYRTSLDFFEILPNLISCKSGIVVTVQNGLIRDCSSQLFLSGI